MSKKIFTLLLLAVFMLAQFSMVSALPTADAVVTVDTMPTFTSSGGLGIVDFTMELPGDPVQNVLGYWREDSDPWNADDCGDIPGNVNGLTFAAGSLSYGTTGYVDQEVFEIYILVIDVDDIVEDSGNAAWDDDCEAHLAFMNLAPEDAQASTFIDGEDLDGLYVNKPTPSGTWNDPASCNTFEMYALVSDSANLNPGEGFSGFGGWNQTITGTFAPPAPEGPESAELSWIFTYPSTASGNWILAFAAEDMVGNANPSLADDFHNAVVTPDELEDCVDFTDVAGHADEVYIRYLADLGLISGNPDGSFGPDNTLTRAEAATLFETANGVTDADPGFGTPPAAGSDCDFTDVSAADWFSGWVWQACADGFMNGVGGGLFDPSNLLTRGQVVTIFNNISNMNGGTGGLLDFTAVDTNLSQYYGDWTTELRSGAWTDVAIGAYYAEGVVNSYGVGIADGTSPTTFSPDQPALRGEFAKMLYRALMLY